METGTQAGTGPTVRRVREVARSRPTVEGAGVRLHRAIGWGEPGRYDPFLLLDDFRSGDPRAYAAGFPWHPHRGMETITYVLRGEVEHADSLGNRGAILPGDVQWMTAGSGIIHQEMPRGDASGRLDGFQLWANLPARDKLMPPRYRTVRAAEIPELALPGGVHVRVVAGAVGDVAGPVRDVVTRPKYLDVEIPPGESFVHPTPRGHTVFAYVIGGRGTFGPEGPLAADRHLLLFDDGELVAASAADEPLRFLLVSGAPIGEPIAWRGPIVMNTEEELRVALQELEDGTFVKARGAVH